jgi:hypothetical protein rflaF_11939
MTYNDIMNRISAITIPEVDYMVFAADNQKCFYGIDSQSRIVFMISSVSQKTHSICQETRSLKFFYNKNCTFSIDGVLQKKTMHLLICKDHSKEKIEAFIRLTYAFSIQETENDQYYLPKLFSSLSTLFDKKKRVSEMELQGLFAELYTIQYFYNNGIDLSKYWQSRNRMKFDFSLNEEKRLEIKSTLKTDRTHHFKHDQLLSELYDIKVASIMLQKSDFGISLGDVISSMRSLFSDNYALMLHIDAITTQIDSELLEDIKYDKIYLDNNIKFFDAANVPHFAEKTPEGVYNAEYDCCLDGIENLSLTTMKKWIG